MFANKVTVLVRVKVSCFLYFFVFFCGSKGQLAAVTSYFVATKRKLIGLGIPRPVKNAFSWSFA